MSLVLITTQKNISRFANRIRELDPQIPIKVWPETGDKSKIEMAVAWKHPQGIFREFANLKVVSSLGAGVDHLLQDPELNEKVRVVRIADEKLREGMRQYVAAVALNYQHGFMDFLDYKQKSLWNQNYRYRKDLTIGILGLGYLGADAALYLNKLGFKVKGFSNSPKDLPGVTSYWGDDALPEFLGSVNFLICLLPLTDQTEGILNRKFFALCQDETYLLNVARGKHVVENDLLEAIDRGKLAGAWLDVFTEEPLPENHSFWKHPQIMITPHVASISDPLESARQIVENYHRLLQGMPFINEVDRLRQY